MRGNGGNQGVHSRHGRGRKAPARATEPEGRGQRRRSVTLTWDAPEDDTVTGYQVLRRRASEGENTLLVYVKDNGSGATSFTDTDVHVYRMKAINEAGLNGRSNYAQAGQ